VGDYLDKPVSEWRACTERPMPPRRLAAFILLCLLILPQARRKASGQRQSLK